MTNTIGIQAITLDLDDTLWPIWPTLAEAEKHLYRWMREHAPLTAAANDTDSLRAKRNEVENLYPQYKHDLSFYRRESIRMLLKENGENEALAEEAFQVYFAARQNVSIFTDVVPSLQRLQNNFPIVGLTNGNANLGIIGLSQFFKQSISAQKFGTGKPDPAFFLEAARVLDLDDCSSILHIGDDFNLDIAAAKQVGFKTAWLKRPELNIPDVPQNQLTLVDYIASDLIDLCQQLGL